MAKEKIRYEDTPDSQEEAKDDLEFSALDTDEKVRAILAEDPKARVKTRVIGAWEGPVSGGKQQLNRDTVKIEYDLTPDPTDLEALLVRKAPAKKIYPSRRSKPTRPEQLTVAAGDAQFPFADPRSLALFHLAVRELQPDNVVLLGDMMDLPSLSRFSQRPEWVGSTNDALEQYSEFLAQTRANAPDARITVVHGNHEQRLVNYMTRNASELLGIKRAGQKLAALSIQNLAGYSDWEIEYVDGYPNGTLWLEDNLKFIHGTNVQKGGSNAAKYLKEERETTIYGHTHRIELANKTYPTRDGGKGENITAASPGALCLTDGSVPGFNFTPDAEGNIVKKAEDWQAGILVIDHKGLSHEVTSSRFHDDRGVKINGKWYDVPVVAAK
jgi:predicted phosphodiesterase